MEPVEPAYLSGASTPIENEPVMDCCLVLTTLSGKAIQLSLSVAKFDRFEDLEDQVMDYLASVTDLAVFGCSIDFLHLATQTYLENPIWDKLQQSKEYCIIFRDCSETLHTQELLEGRITSCAFAHCKHLRTLQLPGKLRKIQQEAAFLKCTSLTEVHVPPTLLYIARRAFGGCTQLSRFERTDQSLTWRGACSCKCFSSM